MNWIIASCLIVTIGSAFVFGHNPRSILDGLLTVISTATLVVFILNAVSDVNDAYEAASKQGIVITTTTWGQRPIATAPCRLELDSWGMGESTVLLHKASDTVVSEKSLKTICRKKD